MIKKDWTVLTNIAKVIFPNLGDKQMGTYDISELKELWSSTEENMNNKIRNITEEYERNKQRIEKEV
jgi:gas vesicle protein